MRVEARLIWVSVCDHCFPSSEQACDHGAGPPPAHPCACSFAGPAKCAECGCECESWDSGLGFVGPEVVRSFFGAAGDENPGFSEYPASKAKLVAAAQEALSEADPSDLDWLARTLPEGTYPDRGTALMALCPVVATSGEEPATLVTALPIGAIAVGTPLVVGPNQTAALVTNDGRSSDDFGPGKHVVSRESAPHAANRSRPPAPGFPRSAISATPFFASTRETRMAFDHRGRTLMPGAIRSTEMVEIKGNITYSIASLSAFLTALGGSAPREGLSRAEGEAAVTKLFGASLDQTLSQHRASEFTPSSPLLDQAIRSAAAQAGLRVSALKIDSVGPVSLTDQLADMQAHQRQAMSHLPPDVQARMQAQMAAAMQRSQAARGSGPGGPPPRAGPAVTAPSGVPPAPTQACPACHSQNPVDGKFCLSCGQPLRAKRSCPRCGKEVAAGVKFCGNCGGPVG